MAEQQQHSASQTNSYVLPPQREVPDALPLAHRCKGSSYGLVWDAECSCSAIQNVTSGPKPTPLQRDSKDTKINKEYLVDLARQLVSKSAHYFAITWAVRE